MRFILLFLWTEWNHRGNISKLLFFFFFFSVLHFNYLWTFFSSLVRIECQILKVIKQTVRNTHAPTHCFTKCCPIGEIPHIEVRGRLLQFLLKPDVSVCFWVSVGAALFSLNLPWSGSRHSQVHFKIDTYEQRNMRRTCFPWGVCRLKAICHCTFYVFDT